MRVIGGLNWGLIGLLGFNLVDTIFGVGTLVSRIIYILVGLSALYTLMVIYKISNKLQTGTES